MGCRFPWGAFQDQMFLFLGDEWLKTAKKKKIILLQLWRLEVQNQSVGGIGGVLPLKAPERNPSLLVCNFWWLSAVLHIPWLVAGSTALPLF